MDLKKYILDGWKVDDVDIPQDDAYVWVLDSNEVLGIARPLFLTSESRSDGWGGVYSPNSIGTPKLWKKIDCKYRKLAIFDLDGTLINTEPPETGKIIWKEKTGNEWSYRGWWGRKESLDISIFDNNLIEETISDYYDESKSDTTLLVLMTGRHTGLINEVKLLLDKYGLVFHELKLNDGGDTLTAKKRQIKDLLFKYPLIEEVEMWEDREPHIDEFKTMFKRFAYKFNINHVRYDNI